MRKLFLAALVIGVCTPAVMAQETAEAGIYGGLQNMRFNGSQGERAKMLNKGPRRTRFTAPSKTRVSMIPRLASDMAPVSLLIHAPPPAWPQAGHNVRPDVRAMVIRMSKFMPAIHSCFSTVLKRTTSISMTFWIRDYTLMASTCPALSIFPAT